MKKYHRWIIPSITALFLTVSGWEIGSEIFAGRHFWEVSSSLQNHIISLSFSIAYCHASYYIIEKMARYFTNKNKENISVKEYLIVVFSAIFLVTVSVFTGNWGSESFWITLTLNYGILIPISFLWYAFLRFKQIAEAYNRQMLQLEKTRSNQLETELKYLRAQYHPHFLFNALNTVYFRIDKENKDAKNTVELLSELLRYQLYNMEEKVDISKEINFIKTYIQFQQLRMTKRLVMNTYFDTALDKQKIYPLIYQPFLENAFKYVGGEYQINLEMKLMNEQIIFHLENSLPEQMPEAKKPASGIGIENIKRRLSLLYPDRHQLNIKQEGKNFIVELSIWQ